MECQPGTLDSLKPGACTPHALDPINSLQAESGGVASLGLPQHTLLPFWVWGLGFRVWGSPVEVTITKEGALIILWLLDYRDKKVISKQ